jgi:chromate transporter
MTEKTGDTLYEQIRSEAEGARATPELGRLFGVWLGLGIQSFGGGAATQYLIRRTFVERYGWVEAGEFTRWWSICPVTPGINLLALTVLIGYRLGGAAGVALSLLGLLLPSVTITVAMTATYAVIRQMPVVQAALRGIVPATVGLGLLMSWQLAQPLFAASKQEGRRSVLWSGALLVASCAVSAWRHPPVVLILCLAGAAAAVVSWARAARGRRP